MVNSARKDKFLSDFGFVLFCFFVVSGTQGYKASALLLSYHSLSLFFFSSVEDIHISIEPHPQPTFSYFYLTCFVFKFQLTVAEI